MIEVTEAEQIERLNARVVELMREREEARSYATGLLVSFVSQHFPPNPDWRPLPDLLGVRTQLDNASTIAREYKAKLASAMVDISKITNANLLMQNQLATARKAMEKAKYALEKDSLTKPERITDALTVIRAALSDEKSQ